MVNSIISEKLLDKIKSYNGGKSAKKSEGADGASAEKKAPAKKSTAKKSADGNTKTEEKKPAAKKTAKSAETKAADAE